MSKIFIPIFLESCRVFHMCETLQKLDIALKQGSVDPRAVVQPRYCMHLAALSSNI